MFGHKARKRTWLYIVGIGPRSLPPWPWRLGDAAFTCGASAVRKKTGKKEISRAEREATPPEFAAWLVDVARRCGA